MTDLWIDALGLEAKLQIDDPGLYADKVADAFPRLLSKINGADND